MTALPERRRPDGKRNMAAQTDRNNTAEKADAVAQEFELQSLRHIGLSGRILSEVAAAYDVSVDEVLSSSRTARLTEPRQVAAYALREFARFSFTQISRTLHRQDHTSAMYSCDRVVERLALCRPGDRLPRLMRALGDMAERDRQRGRESGFAWAQAVREAQSLGDLQAENRRLRELLGALSVRLGEARLIVESVIPARSHTLPEQYRGDLGIAR